MGMHESSSWRFGHVSIEMAWGSEGSWVEKDRDDCNKNHEERGEVGVATKTEGWSEGASCNGSK